MAVPIGVFAGRCLQDDVSTLGLELGGITLALIIATIAVADGQAWGAVVISLYGAGMGLLYASTVSSFTRNEAAFVALHAAASIVALSVAFGLARGRPEGSASVGVREVR